MVENLVIIGSGPAWHTAAIYAWRAELKPLMFEWFMAWWVAAGGQLTTTTDIENFPGFPDWVNGFELMMKMRDQSVNSWTRIETKTVDKVDFSSYPYGVHVGDQIIKTKSIIIATWATAKKLKIEWWEKYWNKWISGCAVCDGALPIFRDKILVVVGWWDVAMEEALHLTKYWKKVKLLVRRDVLRASKNMQNKVFENPKIEILWFHEVKEALWNEKELTNLKILNNQTWEEKIIEAWWLFFAIWHTPNTSFLWWEIEKDDTGYIITKSWTTQTNIKWVFAAWDVQDKKFRQAITSAGTWCMAAMEVEHFLNS